MLHFRQAAQQDARSIRSLIYRVGINPLSLDWRRFLVVVDENDRLIGCGQIKPHGDGTRELASIAVIPECQGKGIGTQIITRLMETEPLPLYLTCSASLATYYQQFGFERIVPPALPPYFQHIWRLASFFSRLYPKMGRLCVMVKRN